jgi:hypothetical protein
MKNTDRTYIFKHAIALLIAGLTLTGFPPQSAQASSNLEQAAKSNWSIAEGFHGKIGVSLHHLKTE